jgi:hypothetical protein
MTVYSYGGDLMSKDQLGGKGDDAHDDARVKTDVGTAE